MALRPNTPYGFKPHKALLQANWYKVASTGKCIYRGDLVRLTTYGVSRAVAGAGKRLLGAALGFIDSTGVPMAYYASGVTGAQVLVADHPDQCFDAQEDCVATCIKYKDMNLNVNFVAARGNTSTGMSKEVIDSSTMAATSMKQLLIVGEVDPEDAVGTQNAVSYKRWVVRIAMHNFVHGRKSGALGV